MAVSILVDQGKLFVRQGRSPEVEYDLKDVSSFVVVGKKFKTLIEINLLEWFFPMPEKPVQLVMKMVDGTEKIIFTYNSASPFKRNWSKFVDELGLRTGKTSQLQECTVS
jgi:hypothetical protein